MGVEGRCKQITLMSQCLSWATGPAPARRHVHPPAHTAQGSRCRFHWDCPSLSLAACTAGLGFRQVPQYQVVLSGADSAGSVFLCPLPGPGSSSDEVFGCRSRCHLSPPRPLPPKPGVLPRTFRQMLTPGPEPQEALVSKKPMRQLVDNVSLGLTAPSWLWPPVEVVWSLQPASSVQSPCSVLIAWQCLRLSCGSHSQFGLLAQDSLPRLPSGHSARFLL